MAAPVLESVLSKNVVPFWEMLKFIAYNIVYIHSHVIACDGPYAIYININIAISVMDKYIDISICRTRVSFSLRHKTSLYTSRAIYRQSVELYMGEVQ